MLYIGSLLVLAASRVSADVRDLYDDDLNPDGTCSSNAVNCFTDGVEAGEFCTNDIVFKGVTRTATATGTQCCYKYHSVYSGGYDCEGKRTSQSHWTLSAQCPFDPNVLTVGLSKNVDSSLCLDGIKFDSACNDPNGCEYDVCLEFPDGGKCCTDMGWVAVKSGKTYCIDEVEVPSCLCETENPTEDPTTSPTKNPTTSPTESPTKNPTTSPTRNPSKSPSTSPTKNPTPSPTPFCEPVVEIHVNGGCTADNFEAWDTNVVYTALRTYQSLSEFEGALGDTPQDTLSGLVLGHSCDTDDQPAAAQQGESSNYIDDDGAEQEPHDVAAPYWADMVTLSLIAYAITASVVAMALWCKVQNKRQPAMDFKHQKVMGSESEVEEAEQNML
jgi:hypothetical protein